MQHCDTLITLKLKLIIRILYSSIQIRQIYGFYATSKEPRRQGSGPSKLLVSFEHCREALVDFQVLPHVVDAQGYARLFKVCKMWELEVVEQLLLAQEAGHANGDTEEHAGEDAISSPLSSAKKDRGLFIRIDSFSKPVQVRHCGYFVVSICAFPLTDAFQYFQRPDDVAQPRRR